MFLTKTVPPEKRQRFVHGGGTGPEHRFTEAAVMLAFALHILQQPDASPVVWVHPDGEHAKVFDIVACLGELGFHREEGLGSTAYGGRYVRADETIHVFPRSGLGDVVGEIGGRKVVAECKGGAINTTHSGQISRLRKGLSELIGQLIILEPNGERQIAVIPETTETLRLARRLAPRCKLAGIEIALVQSSGTVRYAHDIG